MLFSDGSDTSKTTLLGVVTLLISQIFASIQFVVEEKLLNSYSCHPLKMVGWEGLWGATIYLILMIIFAQIPCDTMDPSLQVDLCSQMPDGHWFVETPIFAIKQVFNGGILCFYVFLYIFSIAVYNYSGISVTKHLSSPARAVLDSMRTITVWLFFLLLPVPADMKETFKWLQLVGFIILLLGTLIFNEIIIVPFFGLDKNTENAIKERENAQVGALNYDSETFPPEKKGSYS